MLYFLYVVIINTVKAWVNIVKAIGKKYSIKRKPPIKYVKYDHCCIQDGGWLSGDFTLIANCFIVASSAVWFPEKYAETAVWNSSSCFCITFTLFSSKNFSLIWTSDLNFSNSVFFALKLDSVSPSFI